MKKFSLILLSVLLAAGCFACGDNLQDESGDIPDCSDISESGNSEASRAEESKEESIYIPEEVYEFLNSEYYLTSKRTSFNTVFVCNYYFVDEFVAGAKLMTTFSDEESAAEYYEIISEDYPDAEIDELTVTHYIEDDEAYYYGFSLDKLMFALEQADYEITLSEAFENYTEEPAESFPSV